jgi:hypothetical protein
MRNSFNLMLLALALFDSGYLVGSILESFRLSFNLATRDQFYKPFLLLFICNLSRSGIHTTFPPYLYIYRAFWL